MTNPKIRKVSLVELIEQSELGIGEGELSDGGGHEHMLPCVRLSDGMLMAANKVEGEAIGIHHTKLVFSLKLNSASRVLMLT
jgi:hypothetical protein